MTTIKGEAGLRGLLLWARDAHADDLARREGARRRLDRIEAEIKRADALLGPPALAVPSPGDVWRPRLPDGVDHFGQPLDPVRVVELSGDGERVSVRGLFRFGRGPAIFDLDVFRGLFARAEPDVDEWREATEGVDP